MSRAVFVALSGLLTATPASAMSTEQFKAEMYCKWLPNLAGPLYCSVWRSKCDLPPKSETRDEIVDRTYDHQFESRFKPVVVSRDDIGAIVDAATALTADSPYNDKQAFAQNVMVTCLQNIGKARDEHDRDSITR